MKFRFLGLLLALAFTCSMLQAALAFETDINLTLNKPVIARNTQSGQFPATNAVDGNPSTFWVSGPPAGTYLVIDLGQVKPFNYLATTNSSNANPSGMQYAAKKGRLEGSNDPAAWSDHANDANWTLITNWDYENRAGKFINLFAPVEYRYVRFYVEEGWTTSSVQIKEWELKFFTILSHADLGTTVTTADSHSNSDLGKTTKLIDGDDSSFWIAGRAPTDSNPYVITLNLSQATYVDTVRLYKNSSAAEDLGPRRIVGYKIYLLEGDQWVKVYEIADDKSLSEAICTFPGRVTEKIRLEVTRTEGGWGYICSIEAKALRTELAENSTHVAVNGATIFGRTVPGASAQLTVEPSMWQAVQTADSSGRLAFTGVQFTEGANTLRLHSLDPYAINPEATAQTVIFDPYPLTVLEPATSTLRLNESIQLNFSKPVDRTTVASGTVKLLDANGQPVPGLVSFNESTNAACFVPTAKLEPETEYTIVVTKGLKGRDGLPLAQQFSWSFITSRKSWRLLSNNKGRSEAYDTGGTYKWNPAPTVFSDVAGTGEEISFSSGVLTNGSDQIYNGLGWYQLSGGHSVALEVDLQKTYHIQELRMNYLSLPPEESGYVGSYTDRKLEELEVLYSIDGYSWQRAGAYLDLTSNSYNNYWAVVPLKVAVRYLKIQLATSTKYLLLGEMELWGDGPEVDCAPPIITNVEPRAGASLLANRSLTIKVDYEEDLPLITNAVTLLWNGENVTSAAQIGEHGLTYTVPAEQAKVGNHTVKVSLTDSQETINKEWTFALVDSTLQIDSIQPGQGAELTGRKPQIEVQYSPLVPGGELSSVRMWLDGEEVTEQLAVPAGAVSYQPAQNLPLGKHWVLLSLTDDGGKTQTKEWEFIIVSSDPVLDRIGFEMPSEVEATVPFIVKLEAQDADGKLMEDYTGDFELEASLGALTILEQSVFAAGRATVKCISEKPGSLELKATVGEVASTSQVIFVDKAPETLQARPLHFPKKIERKGEVVTASLFVNQTALLQVKILNLQGQLMNSHSLPTEPGEFQLYLPGENQRGELLPNGLYIILLEFQNQAGSKLQLKMPLIIHYLR